MGAIASQITSLTIVYLTVYSDADQRKQQSSASLAFVRGIHHDSRRIHVTFLFIISTVNSLINWRYNNMNTSVSCRDKTLKGKGKTTNVTQM